MAVTTSIRVEGARLVRQGLQNLDRQLPLIGAQRIFEAMKRARRAVIRYPSPPSGSRYKRTGIYGKGWKIRRNPRTGRKSDGYSLLGQARQQGRDYTVFVSGSARGGKQAPIHQNRWKPVREAINDEIKALPKDIEKHIGLAARRLKL